MNYSPTQLAFAALLAVIYGVLFSISYPLVEISGGIVALCALLGIVTCLAAAAIWNMLTRPKAITTDTNSPAHPAGTNPRARHSSRRERRQHHRIKTRAGGD